MNIFVPKTRIAACISLFLLAGCSTNQTVVIPEAPAASTAVAPKSVEPEKPLKSLKVINGLAAIVNDDIITTYDVTREAELLVREKQKPAPLDDAARRQLHSSALDALIEKTLIRQKIRELNIKVGDDEIKQSIDDVKKQNNLTQEALVAALSSQGITFEQYRSQLVEQLEKIRLISMEVRSNVHVTESEVLAYYQANPAKYSEEDVFRARHIFFKINEKTPADEAKRTMTNALTVLAEAKGGQDFIELAKKHSQDPAASKDGGDMGSFKKGDMQAELESAISALKPGEVSELVYTPLGFHIIKLESRTTGKLKPLESVKAEIQEQLYRKKSEERFARWATELRAKASIEIKGTKSQI